jgi:cholera toxin transcriptional activator
VVEEGHFAPVKIVAMPADPSNGVFRFGVYEANARTGELRKSGLRLRLQDQPFQALLMLLERPGDVVTREELRQRLWPADTFVDFDHSLNTVMNKVREALNDSASNPRFIETLARRGYRFLAPVEFSTAQLSAQTPASPPADPTSPPQPNHPTDLSSSWLTHPDELPAVPRHYTRFLFVLIQIMYLSFYFVALARFVRVQELLDQIFGSSAWAMSILVLSALIGVPIRLYFASAAAFDVAGLSRKFRRLFPLLFPLDEIWALSPFLLTRQIGLGLALAATAALIYVPFAQRTLLLMGDLHNHHSEASP